MNENYNFSNQYQNELTKLMTTKKIIQKNQSGKNLNKRQYSTSLQFKIKFLMLTANNQPNKTQYLNLIDKCTQIIREDRIWLRNLLKANNQDVLYLFKGIPKNIDMKQLQIKLRKYIMRAKEKEKQQQLMRFKENMQLPDFVQMAAQKRHQAQYHNKSQTKLRGPLKQSQTNEVKSSFVAKWNNYTHYNPSIHLAENRSHVANQQSQSQNKSLNKQWTNNYKPHSFNKSLNGELANKLSTKNNSSFSRNNRHNKSATSLTKEKNSIVNSRFQNQEVDEMNQSSKYPFGTGRSSSKSLKQLESKIYEELRLFQHNKAKKQAQLLNRSYSQRSVQKHAQKQKQKPQQPTKQPQPKTSSISKQNIDQILKFKLGNCDYQAYRKSQQTQQDQDSTEYVFKEKSASQKKFYDGMFPPIEEQTERDSESQRYPEEPLRFGMMNGNNSKTDYEDKHKITFASFAKASPNQTMKNYEITDAKMITSTMNNVHEFNEENTQFYPSKNDSMMNSIKNSHNIECLQSIPQKKISQSLYASAQKKSDANENYIESELHKSIMESINKSRESFNNREFSNNSNLVEGIDTGTKNFSSGLNFMSDKSVELPAPKVTTSISSFQSSLYSSTHDDQGLFTSPQLLNQCRNFLKKTQQINFENSGLKQMAGSVLQSKFDSPLSSQQKSFRQTFNNLSNTGMISFPQPITITESITKDFYNSQARINNLFESKQSSASKGNNIEFQTYSKPEYIGGQDSFKKSDFMQSSMKKSGKQQFFGPQSMKKDQVNIFVNHSRKASSIKKHSEIQETIAIPPNQFNMSNNSKQENQPQIPSAFTETFKTSEFPNIAIKPESSRKETVNKEEPISNLIYIEDIIDKILQANEGNIEVDSTWLKHTINNRYIFNERVGSALRKILAEFIESQASYNFIQIMDCIEKQYKKNPQYEPRKSPSRDICSILDIEQKGFITLDDIQNFVNQLSNAGVDNIEQITDCLEEVFNLADFMERKQISYTNLYIIKNQDCFQNLWGYLQDFEFEVSPVEQ